MCTAGVPTFRPGSAFGACLAATDLRPNAGADVTVPLDGSIVTVVVPGGSERSFTCQAVDTTPPALEAHRHARLAEHPSQSPVERLWAAVNASPSLNRLVAVDAADLQMVLTLVRDEYQPTRPTCSNPYCDRGMIRGTSSGCATCNGGRG